MSPPAGLDPFEVWFDGVDRQEITEAGLGRFQVNREKGHVSHHQGIPGPFRDELGVAGERAAAAFLAEHGIRYEPAPEVTANWGDITQDLVVTAGELGVKATAVKTSWEEIWEFEAFLYPDKRQGAPGLSLDYPDHLLVVAVNLEETFGISWVVGAFSAFDVIGSPVKTINGKPAHQVRLDKLVELGAFLNVLRGKELGRPDLDRPSSPSRGGSR